MYYYCVCVCLCHIPYLLDKNISLIWYTTFLRRVKFTDFIFGKLFKSVKHSDLERFENVSLTS